MRKCFFLWLLFIPNKIWAQSYMHEASEDADGNPVGGIVALVIVFGVIYLINSFFKSIKQSKEIYDSKQKIAISISENSLKINTDISIFQNDRSWRRGYIKATFDIQNNRTRGLSNRTIGDLIREYHEQCNLNKTEADKIMEQIGYFQHLDYNINCLEKSGREMMKTIDSNKAAVIPVSVEFNPTNSHVKNDKDFALQEDVKSSSFDIQCVELYGDYLEIISGICLSIKEDGQYRIIRADDARYKPLHDYVIKNHKERISPANTIVGEELIYRYLQLKIDSLPVAKPMEIHGLLEKEFFGGKLIALEAYYCKNFFVPNIISLGDYILALGYKLSVYLHKYIRTPMDYAHYYDLRVMQIQEMTITEYKDYRKKAGQWHESDEGWIDGWWGKLGNTYSEARDNYDKKQGYSYEQAIKDSAKIEWFLE